MANVLAQRAAEGVIHERSDLVAAALGVTAGLAFGPMRRAIRPVVDRALPARSRLTLLFTDIVESTQAIVDLGDEQWRDVLDRFRALVRQELARHRGREVNTAGDAFFAVFDRPMNAVRCAIAMRDGVKGLGLRIRTGLHCGEVEMRGEQVTGLAVHAAARVMGLAGEGKVLISATSPSSWTVRCRYATPGGVSCAASLGLAAIRGRADHRRSEPGARGIGRAC